MSYARAMTFDEWELAAFEAFGDGALGDGPLARVYTLSNEIEAQLLLGILEHERIDAIVQTYREMAFDGLFIPQRGWGCIITREEDSTRAVEVIQAALASVHEPPETEER